jgi:spermidine/putrescine transport system substrate-binding protein
MTHARQVPIRFRKTEQDAGLIHHRRLGAVTRRSALVAGAAATGMAVLGGFGRRALASNEVNYLGWEGYDDAFAAGSVLKDNDVVLKTSYIASNEDIIAKGKSGGLGTMDIVTPDAAHTPFMKELGILQPLDLSKLPNFSNIMPEFQEMPGFAVDGQQWSLPFEFGSIPLMYDADVISEAPTSWMDMFRPELKGKVALVEDLISAVVTFALAATNTKTPTQLTRPQLDETLALMIKFKKEQARAIVSTYGELANLFGNKEIVMAPSWQPVSVWAGSGAPNLKWLTPREGCMVFVDCMALAAKAPNRDLAYKLLDASISAEGQAKAAEDNLTGVTVSNAVPLLSEKARSIYPYDDIRGFFAPAGGGTYPLWPLEEDGVHVTFDGIQDAWEKFLQA